MEGFGYPLKELNDIEFWKERFGAACREYLGGKLKDIGKALDDFKTNKYKYFFGVCNVDNKNENWIVFALVSIKDDEKSGKNLQLLYKLHLEENNCKKKVNNLHDIIMTKFGDQLTHVQNIGLCNSKVRLDSLSLAFIRLISISDAITNSDNVLIVNDRLENKKLTLFYDIFFKVAFESRQNVSKSKFLKIYQSFKYLIDTDQYHDSQASFVCSIFNDLFARNKHDEQIINLGFEFIQLLSLLDDKSYKKLLNKTLIESLENLARFLLQNYIFKKQDDQLLEPKQPENEIKIEISNFISMNNSNKTKMNEPVTLNQEVQITINTPNVVQVKFINMNIIKLLNHQISLLKNMNSLVQGSVSMQSVFDLFVKIPDVQKRVFESQLKLKQTEFIELKKNKDTAKNNAEKKEHIMKEINSLKSTIHNFNNCLNFNEATNSCNVELLVKLFFEVKQTSMNSGIPIDIVLKILQVGIKTSDKDIISDVKHFTDCLFSNQQATQKHIPEEYFALSCKILVECTEASEQKLREDALLCLKKHRNHLNPMYSLVLQVEELCEKRKPILEKCWQLLKEQYFITFNAFLNLADGLFFDKNTVLFIKVLLLKKTQAIPQTFIEKVKSYLKQVNFNESSIEIKQNLFQICSIVLLEKYIVIDDIPIALLKNMINENTIDVFELLFHVYDNDNKMRQKIFNMLVTAFPDDFSKTFYSNRILKQIGEVVDLNDMLTFLSNDDRVDVLPIFDMFLNRAVTVRSFESEKVLQQLNRFLEILGQRSKTIVDCRIKKVLMTIQCCKVEIIKKGLLKTLKDNVEDNENHPNFKEISSLREITHVNFNNMDDNLIDQLTKFNTFIQQEVYLASETQIEQLILTLNSTDNMQVNSLVGQILLKIYNKQGIPIETITDVTKAINNNKKLLRIDSIVELAILAIKEGKIVQTHISETVWSIFMMDEELDLSASRKILNLMYLITKQSSVVPHMVIKKLFTNITERNDDANRTFAMLILHKNLGLRYKTKILLETICLEERPHTSSDVSPIRNIVFKLLRDTATKEFINKCYQPIRKNLKVPSKYDFLIQRYIKDEHIPTYKLHKLVQAIAEGNIESQTFELSLLESSMNADVDDIHTKLLMNELLIQIQKMLNTNMATSYKMNDIEINYFIENVERLKSLASLPGNKKTLNEKNCSVNDILTKLISEQKRNFLVLEDVNDILQYFTESIDNWMTFCQNSTTKYNEIVEMWLKSLFINRKNYVESDLIKRLNEQLTCRPKIFSEFLLKSIKYPINQLISFLKALNTSRLDINRREEILMTLQATPTILTYYRKMFEEILMEMYLRKYDNEYIDEETTDLIKTFSIKLSRLIMTGWKVRSIFKIIKNMENLDKLQLINSVVDLVYDHQLTEHDFDTSGTRLISLLTKPKNVHIKKNILDMISMQRDMLNVEHLEIDQKKMNDLLHEMVELNGKDVNELETKITELYVALNSYIDTESTRKYQIKQSIREYTIQDILMVKDELSVLTQAQRLAVVLVAATNYFAQKLSDSDLISLICLLEDKQKGKIVQQADFQNSKSLVIPIAAVIKASEKKKVDIVVNFEGLAEDLYEKHKKFYKIFDIRASYLTKNTTKLDIVYDAGIIYGSAEQFELDVLQNKRIRSFDTAFVTDMTSLLFNGSNHMVMDPTDYIKLPELTPLISKIWAQINELDATIQNNSCSSKHTLIKGNLARGTAIKEYTKFYMKLITGDEEISKFLGIDPKVWKIDDSVDIPDTLKEYVSKVLLEQLIDQAFAAKFIYNVGEHYEMIQNEFKFIHLGFDFNEWLWFKSMNFCGLRQFLQLKHDKKITPIGIPTRFLTNFEFFQKYHGNIYGICDVVETDEQIQLQCLYGRKTTKIPSAFTSNVENLSSIYTWNAEQWCKEIVNSCSRRLEDSKSAIVVFTKNSNDLKSLNDVLKIKYGEKVDSFDLRQGNILHNIQLTKTEKNIFIVNVDKSDDFVFRLTHDGSKNIHICWTFYPKTERYRQRLKSLSNLRTIQLIMNNNVELDESNFIENFGRQCLSNGLRIQIEIRHILKMQQYNNKFIEFKIKEKLIENNDPISEKQLKAINKKFGIWLMTTIQTCSNNFDLLKPAFEQFLESIKKEITSAKTKASSKIVGKFGFTPDVTFNVRRKKENYTATDFELSLADIPEDFFDRISFAENRTNDRFNFLFGNKNDLPPLLNRNSLRSSLIMNENLTNLLKNKNNNRESLPNESENRTGSPINESMKGLEPYLASCFNLIKQKLELKSDEEMQLFQRLASLQNELLHKYSSIDDLQNKIAKSNETSIPASSNVLQTIPESPEKQVIALVSKDTYNIGVCYQNAVSQAVNRQIVIYNEEGHILRVLGDNILDEPVKLLYQNSSENNWSLMDYAEPYLENPTDNHFINLVAYELSIDPFTLKDEVVKILATNLQTLQKDTSNLYKVHGYKDNLIIVMACYKGQNENDAEQIIDESEDTCGDSNPTAFGHARSHVLGIIHGKGVVIASNDKPEQKKTAFITRQEQDIIAHAILTSNVGKKAISRLNDEHVLRVSVTMAISKLNLPQFFMKTYVGGSPKPNQQQPICGLKIVMQHNVGKRADVDAPVHVLTFYPQSRAPLYTKMEEYSDED